MSYGIKLLAIGHAQIDPPEWVVAFEPDSSQTDPPTYPTGTTDSDPDPGKAKRFLSFAEAAEFWKTQSKTVPYRPDGKPNRPLTAFTVEIVVIPDTEGGDA
jgi:hypothetical protein